MDDELDASVLAALRESRLDISLDFELDADAKRGAVSIRDAGGRTVLRLPVSSPEEMNVVLARLVVLGFAAERPGLSEPPAARSRRRATPSQLVAGVDGYRSGWVAVSLDPSGDVQVSTHATFADVLSLRAAVIAVDIPIDPSGRGDRAADAAARAFVRGRASSVFSTPPRAALEASTFAEAVEIARTVTGKGISQQAFALGRKILEVNVLAGVDERVVEMHPEVSFCALAEEALPHSKHAPEGLAHRRALLQAAGIELPGAVTGVPEADLLDAAIGAWTAARYADRAALSLPPGHEERLGAIWA